MVEDFGDAAIASFLDALESVPPERFARHTGPRVSARPPRFLLQVSTHRAEVQLNLVLDRLDGPAADRGAYRIVSTVHERLRRRTESVH
jgi:hypothetical protein